MFKLSKNQSVIEIITLKAIRLNPLSKGKEKIIDFFRKMISYPQGTIRQAVIDRDVKIFVDLSERIQSYMYFIGEYERHETRKFISSISPGDVILDVGANIGYYSMIASKRVGKNGHVFAFEAYPIVYELLCQNCCLSKVDNITPLCIAIADQEGILSFKIPRNPKEQGSGSLVKDGSGNIKVEAITLDKFIQEKDISRLDFIKMDIEGAELKAFLGMKETICRYQPQIMFEWSPNRYEEQNIAEFKSLLELMNDLGYVFQILNRNGRWSTIKSYNSFPVSGVWTIYANTRN